MLRRHKLTISIVSGIVSLAVPAFAQPTPQQIQQHQMAIEQALRESQEREQKQHQAQIEQMEQVDRQAAQAAREQAEQQAKLKAIAAQEQLYLQQQAEEQAKAHPGNQDQDPAKSGQANQAIPGPSQPSAQQSAVPPPAVRWSLKNMSNPDKFALGGLGLLLVALAFAAGILPSGLFRPGRQ